MRPAMFQSKEESNIRCNLCPHSCLLHEGAWGICGARRVENGQLMAKSYGVLAAIHVDPVEKKPLRHFLPGTKTLSVGSLGCNLFCPYCQNVSLSRNSPGSGDTVIHPDEVVQKALSMGLPSISYTYNEPFTFYEFMYDTAKSAHEKGLKNIIVTNGYVLEPPLFELLPYIDAMNIDLKTFNDESFLSVCKGELSAVIRSIVLAVKFCHVEITMLMVPGLCGSIEVQESARWLSGLSDEIPLHISRYFPRGTGPNYPTPVIDMVRAEKCAKQFLKNVYLGNL